jgi:hypothetical protein
LASAEAGATGDLPRSGGVLEFEHRHDVAGEACNPRNDSVSPPLRGGAPGFARIVLRHRGDAGIEGYLQVLELWCWTYHGNPRNYAGLHLTGKPNACETLLRLTAWLRNQPDGTHRTLTLKRLSADDESKITGGMRFRDFRKLRIVIRDPAPDLRQMCLWENDGTSVLEFVRTYLSEFEEGLQDVKEGRGDYCIGPFEDKKKGELLGFRDRQSRELWFWPCFGHLMPIP